MLGATGSIGCSTLDVIRQHPDAYRVYALTANENVDLLYHQCCEFKPQFAVVRDEHRAGDLQSRLAVSGVETTVLNGPDALERVAADDGSDTVMAAIVGGAGLVPTLAAAAAGKKLLLANKEALVMSGRLFMDAIVDSGAVLLPIDSEHNAIYQCLPQSPGCPLPEAGVAKLVLTASGGPFLNTPLSEFSAITPAQACAHPNWTMGRKISVDSATMMNKGLEVIEASWFFGVPVEQIEVLIHPQSIVHSMVEYVDGSVLAQLGQPDMRTPIAHGLAWPSRIRSGVASLNLGQLSDLHFEKMDEARFPCMSIAMEVARTTNTALSAVMNAANEVAVAAFLDELIAFTDIPIVIRRTVDRYPDPSALTIDEILALDADVRKYTTSVLGHR